MTIQRVRALTGCGRTCASTVAGREAFLEEAAFLLVWGREGIQAEGTANAKAGKRTDSTPPGRQVPKGLTHTPGEAGWVEPAAREPGSLPLDSRGATSKLGDLGQGTSLLGVQFLHV